MCLLTFVFESTLFHFLLGKFILEFLQGSREYEGRRGNPSYWPYPIVIPLKLFLALLRDPVFPRGLTDSQSHVSIFTNVDS